MAYKFDNYGWYDGDADGDRTTNIQPANLSMTTTPGELRANFTGYEWLDLPYVAPVIVEPKQPVPPLVSKFKAKAALLNAGHLATVEAIMANPATPELMRLAWTEAQEFRRDSPTVAAMAAALDLTDEDVDNLFVYAEGVSA